MINAKADEKLDISVAFLMMRGLRKPAQANRGNRVLENCVWDEVKDIKVLGQLLITAFSKRRKTVRNALRSYLTTDDLEQLKIDPGLRPENLKPEEYFRCANYITDNPSA